jgi:hypothetical protein
MFAPNTIIENLLQQKKHQAAMTLDALFASDAAQFPSIEISAILHYFRASGIGIGESIVRRGLFDLARLGLMATRKIMTRTKGRPRWEYRLASLSGMAQVLGLKLHRDENRDSVPFTAFKSGRAYRGAKHYSFIKRLGTSYLSRKKLGARLGVGGRSTFNYEQGTNIKAEQRIEEKPLFKYDIPLAPEKRLNQNIFLKVEFVRELSEAELEETYKDYDPAFKIFWKRTVTDHKYMPYTRFILERELAAGHTVFLVKQVTNEYSIAS